MRSADLRALGQLARWHGVLTEYQDVSKRRVSASPEALQAVLRSLGVPVAHPNEAKNLLEKNLTEHWHRPLDPVMVAWHGQGGGFELRLPEAQSLKRSRAQIRLEGGDGSPLVLERSPIEKRALVDGVRYLSRRVRWPKDLPPGYHTLELDGPDGRAGGSVICAPIQAWAPDKSTRSWGVFAPLYSLHSQRSPGIGDYTSLRELMEWAAEQGGRMVSTLPLLPVFLPGEPSPYSPISKLFWNEFYVDVSRVPEWSLCREAREVRAPLGAKRAATAEWVDYPAELALKRSLLEALARFFFSKPSERRTRFDRWLNPLVRRYAEFRAVTEARGESWTRWPERLREGVLKEGDYDKGVRDYHLYAQWLAQEQMADLSARSKELDSTLYLDMPLGVHADGFDVWHEPKLFASEVSGGSPPDDVFTKGQDWGFAPLHPGRLREQGYRYIISFLRHHLQHAHALRFDHVMGLHRLFWVPRGLPASSGAYVRYAHEDLYAILSLESHRHRSLIVGENLGTVPPAVNQGMKRHGIRQMYVVQYEVQPDPKRALRSVPAQSVASLNTHDMPPFAAFWEGTDIADRCDLGWMKKHEVGPERKNRAKIKQAMQTFLRARGHLGRETSGAAMLRACLGYLSASRAEWVLVNLEDLWLEKRCQNTPGTTEERINWRGKTRFSLEDVATQPEVVAGLEAVVRRRNQRVKR